MVASFNDFVFSSHVFLRKNRTARQAILYSPLKMLCRILDTLESRRYVKLY